MALFTYTHSTPLIPLPIIPYHCTRCPLSNSLSLFHLSTLDRFRRSFTKALTRSAVSPPILAFAPVALLPNMHPDSGYYPGPFGRPSLSCFRSENAENTENTEISLFYTLPLRPHACPISGPTTLLHASLRLLSNGIPLSYSCSSLFPLILKKHFFFTFFTLFYFTSFLWYTCDSPCRHEFLAFPAPDLSIDIQLCRSSLLQPEIFTKNILFSLSSSFFHFNRYFYR